MHFQTTFPPPLFTSRMHLSKVSSSFFLFFLLGGGVVVLVGGGMGGDDDDVPSLVGGGDGWGGWGIFFSYFLLLLLLSHILFCVYNHLCVSHKNLHCTYECHMWNNKTYRSPPVSNHPFLSPPSYMSRTVHRSWSGTVKCLLGGIFYFVNISTGSNMCHNSPDCGHPCWASHTNRNSTTLFLF